jgi:hypothetical protein
MLFRALFVCAAGFDALSDNAAAEKIFFRSHDASGVASANFDEASANSKSRSPLKPETAKCYSRQLEPAIEIIFASHAPCVLRRKRVLVTERKAEEVVSRRDGDDGNGSSRHYFYVFGMLTTSTQIFTGAFRSHRRDGTHGAETTLRHGRECGSSN